MGKRSDKSPEPAYRTFGDAYRDLDVAIRENILIFCTGCILFLLFFHFYHVFSINDQSTPDCPASVEERTSYSYPTGEWVVNEDEWAATCHRVEGQLRVVCVPQDSE